VQLKKYPGKLRNVLGWEIGGLILATGHSLKYPEEKIGIMMAMWEKNGMYRAGNSRKS